MSFSIRLFLIFCILFLSLTFSAKAMTEEETEHARSSFLFLQRKEWNDALLHARATHDESLQTLVVWQYLLDVDNGASFSEIRQFIDAHPEWPEPRKLKIRAEMALKDSSANPDEIIEWFAKNTPITGVGKIALIKSLLTDGRQSKEMISSLVREAWRDGDFDEAQEQSLLANYGNMLRASDDIARTDRLLWEGKISAAERMFARVDTEHQKLYKARIEFQTDKKDALKVLSKVAPSLRKDAGLIYDRMRFHAKNKDDSLVRDMLIIAPPKVPYPEKWWKFRETKIREALADDDIAMAAHLLTNHGQTEGQGFADASWLRGRLLLEYQKKPQEAYSVFSKMFSAVKYPVSKARAAYFAAKSAQKIGNHEAAKKWMNIAAAYPTSFYGQIAALEYSSTAPLNFPLTPQVSPEERAAFNARSVVRAIKLCLEFNQPELAGKIINYMAENAETGKEAMLVSELGAKSGKIYLSVRGAKKALQSNLVLIDTGYPIINMPDNLALPRALALAITRQESEFDRFAKSPAGAVGLMQLLPSTAKETARKNDIAFDEDRLYEADYNITLGSFYLRRLIGVYDGSLPMAIAAYNAGGGNVNKWIKKFGRPHNSVEGMIDWIEKIPFSETRNYVQRVLENLQIYRHLESGDGSAKLLLGDDLVTN